MESYATLKDMGIGDPDQIARYTLYASEHTDYLRIIYRRKPGSLLAQSHRYKFPRAKKTVVVDSGTRRTETITESSQFLKSAVAELEAVVSQHHSVEDIKRVLNEEVAHLEEEVTERIAHIKTLVERIN